MISYDEVQKLKVQQWGGWDQFLNICVALDIHVLVKMLCREERTDLGQRPATLSEGLFSPRHIFLYHTTTHQTRI